MNKYLKADESYLYIIFFFALTSFLLHFLTNLTGAYGLFRDELYYIACSDHLAWGYVDHPPLSVLLLKFTRTLFGESLPALRLLPALAISFTILFTGLITKELGGKAIAVLLACTSIFCSGIHTVMGGFYSMNSIDILIWAIGLYIYIKIVRTRNSKLWLLLGVILGLGLMNKISVLFLGAGLFASLLFTNERKWLLTKWPYLCGIIAFILFLPYIIWNLNHDLAHLEFIKNAQEIKYSGRTRVDFLLEQVFYIHPLNLLIWLTGLLAFFFFNQLKPFRALGWVFIVAFFILFINKTSKGEYLAPCYCILFASAGVFIENQFNKLSIKVFAISYFLLLFISATLLLPVAIPILPVENYMSYSKQLGLPTASSEGKKISELPQFYADMFGWEQKALDVAKVYNALPDYEREKCAIYASNYGRCGAIDFYGQSLGLPASIGSHNNYWLWGTGSYTGEIMIIVGGQLEDHKDGFESCEIVAVSDCNYCMPYEDNLNIFLCKGLKKPLHEIWPEEKNYE